jgi:hypothetical protein
MVHVQIFTTVQSALVYINYKTFSMYKILLQSGNISIGLGG